MQSAIGRQQDIQLFTLSASGAAQPRGDEEIFAQLNAELGPGAQPIETRTLSADATTIAQQLGDLTVICGMRFHALVLAAMLGRPFAGIAHDNKISEICRAFAMPCYSVDGFVAGELVSTVNSLKDRVPDSRAGTTRPSISTGEFPRLRGSGVMKIVLHGFGTYPFVFRHLVAAARKTAPQLEWAVILPNPHHRALMREVVDDNDILSLQDHLVRDIQPLRDASELSRYPGRILREYRGGKVRLQTSSGVGATCPRRRNLPCLQGVSSTDQADAYFDSADRGI